MSIIRVLALLCATLVFAACSEAPVPHSKSGTADSTQSISGDRQKASTDSVVQYLLTSAATDFHAHGPSGPLRFRNVRLGHLLIPSGEVRYGLCGQFLPAQAGDKAEWTPFATIKTSGYEQYVGRTIFCEDPKLVWDDVGDLSDLLQSRFDSLR